MFLLHHLFGIIGSNLIMFKLPFLLLSLFYLSARRSVCMGEKDHSVGEGEAFDLFCYQSINFALLSELK